MGAQPIVVPAVEPEMGWRPHCQDEASSAVATMQVQALAFQRALLQNPRDARALVGISLIAMASRQTEPAMRTAWAAVEAAPEMLVVWVTLGQTLRAAGRYEESEQACRHALCLDGESALAHIGLGELWCTAGRPLDGLTEFEHVLQSSPDQAAAHLGKGHALVCLKRNEEALSSYGQVIALRPQDPDAFFASGFVSMALRRPQQAEAYYRQAIRLSPEFAAAWVNLGQLLIEQGRPAEAEAALRRSLDLSPTLATAWINLARLERDRGRAAMADAYLRRALALDEHRIETLLALSQQCFSARDFPEAWKWLHKAESRQPDHPEVANVQGILLHAEGRLDDALTMLERAERLGSESATSNRGNVLLEMSRGSEALAAHRAAVQQAPEHAGALYNLALTELRMGEWAHGWGDYEARWQFREVQHTPPNFTQPRWQGEMFEGRRLLLYSEQGFGDTIQFCRYLPRVLARGGSVTLEVQPAVERLVRSMAAVRAGEAAGRVQVIARTTPRPQFDLECPLMSLPAVFGTTVDSVPWAGPYLAADAELAEQRLLQYPSIRTGLRIAFSWAGNPRYKADAVRSTDLHTLMPLLRTRGVNWISLQKGEAARQLANLPNDLFIWDGSSHDRDFAETAALASTADRILTTDTAIAHLGGAMGLPVWLLLAYHADWRWMEATDRSPWYPTMRIFRQPAKGDWPGLLRQVSALL